MTFGDLPFGLHLTLKWPKQFVNFFFAVSSVAYGVSLRSSGAKLEGAFALPGGVEIQEPQRGAG